MKLLALSALALAGLTATASADFYVSPSGADTNEGSVRKPFKTLNAARDAVRALKAKPKNGTTVWLAGGTYQLANSFQLGPEDSGTAAAPVTFRAQKGHPVILSGGRSLPKSAFVPVTNPEILERVIDPGAKNHLVQTDLKALGITDYGRLTRHGFSIPGSTPPLELYLNGDRQLRARWPNTSSVRLGRVLDKGATESDPDFKTRGGKFELATDRAKYWTKAKDIWLSGVFGWDWAWSYNQVASIDPATNAITLTNGEVYGVFSGKDFLYAENLLEEIDQPGESYLDRESGILYWWPPVAFATASPDIQVSLLNDPLIRLTGTRNVAFRDLYFQNSREIGIQGDGTENVTISHCAFKNLGAGAIAVKGSHNRVESCDISDVGNTAIRLDGGNKEALTPGENVIDNCRFQRWGYWQKVYNPGVSLRGVGNRVTHCLFTEAPHCAIIVNGNNHLIEANEFHDVLLDFKDMGVIYMNLGHAPLDRGTVIRHNYFHDIGQAQDKVNGVYPDNGTMGLTVEGNIFARFGSPTNKAVKAIGGNGFSYVKVRNNVFVDCVQPYELSFFLNDWAKNQIPKYQEAWKNALSKIDLENGPYVAQYPELKSLLTEDRIQPDTNTFEGNLIYNPTLPRNYPGAFATRSGPESKVQAKDNWIATEDPGFVNLQKSDFRRRPNSPALKNIPNLTVIPTNKIGPQSNLGPDN